MSLTPFSIERFGGLNLRDDPGELGPEFARTAHNVDFWNDGTMMGSRAQYSEWANPATAGPVDSLASVNLASDNQIIVGLGNDLEVFDSAGSPVATTAAPTTGPHHYTLAGTATAEYLYIANGTDQIRRWDGAAFSTPAGLATQTGKHLGVTPWDNRMVHGNTATNRSRVAFSDPDTPETFTAANYVDLTPGDGEEITAIVTWQNELYVFKESKFFVFYGTSTDAAGDARFDYRTVAGQGANVHSTLRGERAAVGPDGVYFVNRLGLWRTTGGPAVNLSGLVDGRLGLNQSETVYGSLLSVAIHDHRVFCNVSDASVGFYVYDIREDRWHTWTIASGDNTVGVSAPLGFYIAAGLSGSVYKPQLWGVAGGESIASTYQSHFYDMGTPEEKRIRYSRVWGAGNGDANEVSLAMGDDYQTPGSAVTLTMGSSIDAPSAATVNVARLGTRFCHKLTATTTVWWRVNRIEHFIAGTRSGGLR